MNTHEIIIGVLTSLIATIIWVILTQLYDLNSRKNIALLLELLYDCSDNFDSAIEFFNYQVAEIEADKIIGYAKEIFINIKPFTYLPCKKRLMYTILYNAYYTISYYKRLWVGYDGETEQKAKLDKFKRKYYYKINIKDSKSDLGIDRSFLIVSIVTLQSLNRHFSVTKALTDDIAIKEYTYNTYLNLVSPINCKFPYKYKYDLRKNCFTSEEYKKYISKKFSRRKING